MSDTVSNNSNNIALWYGTTAVVVVQKNIKKTVSSKAKWPEYSCSLKKNAEKSELTQNKKNVLTQFWRLKIRHLADIGKAQVKSACDPCFHINRVDSTVTRDITRTDSVQTVNHEDVEVTRHLHSTATLSAQVLHTVPPHCHGPKQGHSVRSRNQVSNDVKVQSETETKPIKNLQQDHNML